MGNFIGMVYAKLKEDGVDTNGMTPQEAIDKYNEKYGKEGKYGDNKPTEAESKRLKEKGIDEETDNKEPKYQPKTSKTIKNELKEKGFDTSKIGVREHHGSFYVTIKDPSIDLDAVEKIAEQYESYDRDVATGEILQGGNTFVFTEYQDGVFDGVAKQYEPKANEYMERIKKYDKDTGFDIGNDGYLMNDAYGNVELVVQNDKQWTRRRIYDAKSLARKLYQLEKFGKTY